ncbi:MAG: chaperone NapD [Piscinibacter sp.]
MSILGAVVRIRPEHLAAVLPRATALPGADVALNPGDGRLVMVLEDAELDGVVHSAAATLAAIALWPEVLNTSLVYEYSGPDAPPAGSGVVEDYRAWRGSLKDWARSSPAGDS